MSAGYAQAFAPACTPTITSVHTHTPTQAHTADAPNGNGLAFQPVMPPWFMPGSPFNMPGAPPSGGNLFTLPGVTQHSGAQSAPSQSHFLRGQGGGGDNGRPSTSSTLTPMPPLQPNANATISTLAGSIADLTASMRSITADMSRLYADLQHERARNAELQARIDAAAQVTANVPAAQ